MRFVIAIVLLCTATASAQQRLVAIDGSPGGEILVRNQAGQSPAQLQAAGFVEWRLTDGTTVSYRPNPGAVQLVADCNRRPVRQAVIPGWESPARRQPVVPVESKPDIVIEEESTDPVAPADPPVKAVDEHSVVMQVLARIKTDPTFRGENGKDAVIDYDKLAEAMLAKMPPVQLQFLDRDGQVVEQETFPFGQPIRIKPIHVQNFDRSGNKVDEEFYPYPGPIRLLQQAKQYAAP
jgi:hypothetical protein